MLRSSLKGLSIPAETLLEKAGVDGSLRAEQLDVVTLCNLARCYQDML
jgi:16S rRNA (adenine1518-N6/adenine1519-N6)-dimethyltransferase